MPLTPASQPISETDYDAIEAAVKETARGRWFLEEFAQRNRNTDTKLVLDAIQRLQRSVLGADTAPVIAPQAPAIGENLGEIERTAEASVLLIDDNRFQAAGVQNNARGLGMGQGSDGRAEG